MIEAYLGLPGAGKTYALIVRLKKALSRPWNRNRRVYSNMPLDEEYLRKITKWQGELIYLYDWEDMVNATNAIIIIDELNLWMPSRVWNKVPGPLLYKWAQVRKSGLEVWFTAQAVSRVDKVVRELVFESYHLTSYKRLNFFVAKSYIGLGDKFTSKMIIPFKMKLAKIYDTHGYINVPEVYQKEMVGNKEDKKSSRDIAFEKEKIKDLEKEKENIKNEKEIKFFQVNGKKLNESLEEVIPVENKGKEIITKSGRKIIVPGMSEEQLKELQRKNPGKYFETG